MIGVFDSGVGGLTVLKEFLRVLPKYDYVYLGDNKRAPYGDKTQKEIYRYTCEAVDFLFSKGCGLIIIACNTASTKALRKIQQVYLPNSYPGKKVLGVIIPTVEEVAMHKYKRVGIIGTNATIKSKKYQKELMKLDDKIKIFDQACPLLVPLIEKGGQKTIGAEAMLESYLKPLKEKKIESLVLGCTHYPLLYKAIRKVAGSKIKIINPPAIIAERLKDYIKRHKEIRSILHRGRTRKYYTTGDASIFKKIGGEFLQDDIAKVEKAIY